MSDEPVIRSGYEQTYACGKDTGRYWDAGAANVHWVIVTDNQVELGIRLALDRVNAPGVLIEGNSFLQFINVDFAVLVSRGENDKIKSSTRWVLPKASAFYLFNDESDGAEKSIVRLNQRFAPMELNIALPIYTAKEFPQLLTRIQQIHFAGSVVC